MEPITTEIVIPISGSCHTIYSEMRIKLTIDDEGAGPFLCIEGIDESDGSKMPHAFYFCTVDEITEFAAICTRMLSSAEGKTK